jgi:hypothetical protein
VDERGLLARWWPLLLPCSYLLHLAEEWWGGEGLAAWTWRTLGAPISTAELLALNGIVWPVLTVLTVLAVSRPGLRPVWTAFGTVIAVNGALHVLGSLATTSYSPGVVSGVLLYLPLGGYALARGRRDLAPRAFGGAVLIGLVLHAVVAAIALD